MDPTDEEKLFAAAAHASGCVGSVLGPLVIWFLKKDTSPFVAYHAIQAAIYHTIAIVAYVVISTVTCGVGTMALPLFWLPALWWAYQAYQGSKEGYPGIAQFGRTEQLTG